MTRLQQKAKIGRVVSSLLLQHVKDTMKTFEELLSSSNIDHSTEQHFRKQMIMGSQMAESIASKLSTGKLATEFRKVSVPPKILGSHKLTCIHEVSYRYLGIHHFSFRTRNPRSTTGGKAPPSLLACLY